MKQKDKSLEQLENDSNWDKWIIRIVSFLAGIQIYDIIKWVIIQI